MVGRSVGRVLVYGGYYSTGGSVVRDIFREFRPRFDFQQEFRVLKEKGGLFDLEDAIFAKIAPEGVDLAIRDYLWLTEHYQRSNRRFSKLGFDYNRLTCGVFQDATLAFVDKIVDYRYPMSWHYYTFRQGYAQQILSKLNKKLSLRDPRRQPGSESAYFSSLTEEEYFSAAQGYMHSILSGIKRFNRVSDGMPVGLHNAIPPFSVDLIRRGLQYLPNARIFITDRDPRDVYLNYPQDSYGRYIMNTGSSEERAHAFVRFYKMLRRDQDKVKLHKNVMFLKFEDICRDYDYWLQRIFEFAELDPNDHKAKLSIFRPEDSIKNVSMWKNADRSKFAELQIIEQELDEFIKD